jgi:restriction endonuclease S subunit
MWSSVVNFDLLQSQGRWKVEYFCLPETSQNTSAKQKLIPIKHLVWERKETVEPKTLGDVTINYIGLEHIQSLTGELVNFTVRNARDVKSRSKIFRENDVLFGRLRPNLNKVWLARRPVLEGICSTEFFVLTPHQQIIKPIILRYLLSSSYVQRHALRLLTGTALPRMSLDDLLEIEVPVPPMEIQDDLERDLLHQFDELVTLRDRMCRLPEQILQNFLARAEAETC